MAEETVKREVELERLPQGKIRVHLMTAGWSVDCLPAIPEMNFMYQKCAAALIAPHQLAIDLNRMGRTPEANDEAIDRLMIRAACQGGVILGSVDLRFSGWSPAQWEAFLMKNRTEWRTLDRIVTMESIWKPKRPRGDDRDDSGPGGGQI